MVDTKARAKLFIEYTDDLFAAPSLEKYLAFRRTMPGGDISAEQLLTVEHLLAAKEELERLGIDPLLVASVHDGDDKAVDQLMLKTIELLVARNRKKRAGETHLQRRGKGIRDATVDYLLLTALQACNVNGLQPPTSLVFLLAERLGGFNQEIHAKKILAEKKSQAAWRAAQIFGPGEKISKRRLAAEISVEPSTIVRWFRAGELEKEVARVHASFLNPNLLKKLKR